MTPSQEVLSEVTVFNKYAKFLPELGRRETWQQLGRRNMDMHIRKFPALEQEISDVYNQFVFPKKVLPSMRSLQFGGRPIELSNTRIFNCFSRDTAFITSKGAKTFQDFRDGQEIVVLTHLGNWKNAVVRNYGVQLLNSVEFAQEEWRTIVRVTANHRWILQDGSETTSLKAGDTLFPVNEKEMEFSSDLDSDADFDLTQPLKPVPKWSVQSITQNTSQEEVWCLEVEDDHSFVLSGGLTTGNCAYLPVETIEAFSETMFLLLSGTGVGYGVQDHQISKLPPVLGPNRTKSRRFLIGDSIEGWADAIKVLIKAYFRGKPIPVFDYRDIRPKGARLITSGGKAPGPEPLRVCVNQVQNILDTCCGRMMTALEAHDIQCSIADAVLSGGIRRAAMIALFSPTNMEMLTCKSQLQVLDWEFEARQTEGGTSYHGYANYKGIRRNTVLSQYDYDNLVATGTLPWFFFEQQRGRANNSAVLSRGGITETQFKDLWKQVENSHAGEPGIFWTNDVDWGTNPCCVTGDMVTTTSEGPKLVRDLVGVPFTSVTTSGAHKSLAGFWSTGVKDVFEVETSKGYTFKTTADHRIQTPEGWVELRDLKIGSDVMLNNARRGLQINRFNADEGSILYHYLGCALPLETDPLSFSVGVLCQVFDDCGKVTDRPEERIQFDLSKFERAPTLSFQRVLLQLGVISTLTPENWLMLGQEDANRLVEIIRLYYEERADRLAALVNKEGISFPGTDFTSTITKITAVGQEEVFDCTVEDSHAFDINGVIVHNCEIALRPYQFCNLCETNVDDITSQEDLNNRVRAAAFLGTLQASYTDFHYLRPIWQETTEKDALIGVGMTGIGSGKILNYNLAEAANVVIAENARVAKILGINTAARQCTVKPSGTTSLVLGCASGIHAWHDEYYIRRMRVGKSESLYGYMKDNFPQLIEDCYFKPTIEAVMSFPQAAPEGSILRTESFLDLLERVKRFNVEWVKTGHLRGVNSHNVSCTISLKDTEWEACGQWMWENKDFYTGISVLPYDGGTYIQAPFESCTKEKFEELSQYLHSIDLSQVYEVEDVTDHKMEPACAGGLCEIILA